MCSDKGGKGAGTGASFANLPSPHSIINVYKEGDHGHRGIKEQEIWHYFTQLCQAVSYLHDKRIMHRGLLHAAARAGRGTMVVAWNNTPRLSPPWQISSLPTCSWWTTLWSSLETSGPPRNWCMAPRNTLEVCWRAESCGVCAVSLTYATHLPAIRSWHAVLCRPRDVASQWLWA